jgi:hypothetical protein
MYCIRTERMTIEYMFQEEPEQLSSFSTQKLQNGSFQSQALLSAGRWERESTTLKLIEGGLCQGCQTAYFQTKKIPIWVNFGGSCNEEVGIFYFPLVYFTTIWYILWPFGKFHGYLVDFFPCWYVVPRKIWQPWSLLRRSIRFFYLGISIRNVIEIRIWFSGRNWKKNWKIKLIVSLIALGKEVFLSFGL